MADNFNLLDFNNSILKVTGQTTDRTPAGRTSKDDGGEQRGEPHKYTVLTTGQYSGTTNITVNAKVDTHSNECALCNVTGLLWNRTPSASVGVASDGKLYWDDTAVSDRDIFEYCDQANLMSLSGFTDWRVPNVEELASLLVHQGAAPYADGTAFPSMPSDFLWSSTTRPDVSTIGIVVSFAVAGISSSAKTSTTFKTLLVRG